MKKIFGKIIYLQAATCCFMYFIFFALSPLQGEDYGLTKRFTNEDLVERFTYAFHKSAFQIEHWNARLGEQLSIFSLSMPSVFFYFVALLSFFCVCILMQNLIEQQRLSLLNWCMFFLLFIALWPGMELFTWRTVITGYTVPMIISLLVCSKFMTHDRRQVLLDNKMQLSIYCVLSFLAGLSFENVPVALIFFLVFVIIFDKKIFTRLALVPAFCLVGWFILMLAPSTAIRKNTYDGWYNVGVPFLDKIKIRALDVISVFIDTSLALFLISLTALVYLFVNGKMKKELLILILSSLMVVGSMVMSPYTEPRSFMFSWCVMLAVVGVALKDIRFNGYKSFLIMSFVGFFAIATMLKCISDAYIFNYQLVDRQVKIESQLNTDSCKTGIKIYPVRTHFDYRYINNRDEWFYQNAEQVSDYYDCKIIK